MRLGFGVFVYVFTFLFERTFTVSHMRIYSLTELLGECGKFSAQICMHGKGRTLYLTASAVQSKGNGNYREICNPFEVITVMATFQPFCCWINTNGSRKLKKQKWKRNTDESDHLASDVHVSVRYSFLKRLDVSVSWNASFRGKSLWWLLHKMIDAQDLLGQGHRVQFTRPCVLRKNKLKCRYSVCDI